MIRVYLEDYFERNGLEAGLLYMRREMQPWIRENVPSGCWCMDGVTRYSFRFEFLYEEDVIAFKLRFGI